MVGLNKNKDSLYKLLYHAFSTYKRQFGNLDLSDATYKAIEAYTHVYKLDS